MRLTRVQALVGTGGDITLAGASRGRSLVGTGGGVTPAGATEAIESDEPEDFSAAGDTGAMKSAEA